MPELPGLFKIGGVGLLPPDSRCAYAARTQPDFTSTGFAAKLSAQVRESPPSAALDGGHGQMK